jgi:hypothetical protein
MGHFTRACVKLSPTGKQGTVSGPPRTWAAGREDFRVQDPI